MYTIFKDLRIWLNSTFFLLLISLLIFFTRRLFFTLITLKRVVRNIIQPNNSLNIRHSFNQALCLVIKC